MTYYKLFQNIMKKNKLFALLVIMLAAATNGWAWSGGNGTASAPYEIGDETDWNDLAYLVNMAGNDNALVIDTMSKLEGAFETIIGKITLRNRS